MPNVIFVATDDFTVIEEFREYIYENGLRINVISTCEPEHSGFALSDIQNLTQSDKYRVLVDAEVCSRAKYFVGTYSSGFGRFIAAKHENYDHCYSLDIDWCHDGSLTSKYSRNVLNLGRL